MEAFFKVPLLHMSSFEPKLIIIKLKFQNA